MLQDLPGRVRTHPVIVAFLIVSATLGGLLLAPGVAASTTFRIVDPADPLAYPTIATALLAAQAGDTVVVRPGTYREAVSVAKTLTLCSTHAGGSECDPRPDLVSIVAPAGVPNGIAISAHSVTVQGFGVRFDGGGVLTGINATTTSGVLNNLQIFDNVINAPPAAASGPVPGESGITARPRGALIARNALTGWRQAVYLAPYGRDATVLNNTMTGNGEGILTYEPGTRITGNVISQSPQHALTVGLINDPTTRASDVVLRENNLAGNAKTIGFRAGSGVTSPPAVQVDARYNRWGAYTPGAIALGMDDNAHSNSTVDTRCFYDVDGTSTICPPSVAFVANPGAPSWNRTVQFHDETASGGRALRNWTWSFGDGAVAYGQDPLHVFALPGRYNVTLTVVDAADYVAAATEALDVLNHAPTLAAITDQAIAEASLLRFTLAALDVDGDNVTYGAGALPAGASLNATSGAFAWTPAFGQAGTYDLRFTASDTLATANQTVRILVGSTDRPPALQRIGNRTASLATQDRFTFTVAAPDPDGDVVRLDASPLPPGAAFSAATGVFDWLPQPGQEGRYTVRFTATDGILTAREDVLLSVVPNARAKVAVVAQNPSTALGSPGQAVRFVFKVTNQGPEADTITLRTTAPAGWTALSSDPTVTLDSAATRMVVVTLTPDASRTLGDLVLRGISSAGPMADARSTLKLPVSLALSVAPQYDLLQTVAGSVDARWRDGTIAQGVPVDVAEQAVLLGNAGGTRKTQVRTGPDGRAAFQLPSDLLGANSPGQHYIAAWNPQTVATAGANYWML